MILSGGSGTRMRPLTHSTAKQLLPIANQPILHRALQQMSEIGIKEVAIIVGSTAEQVRDSVGDGQRFNVAVSYVEQDQPLGLAHCVMLARNFLGEEDFIMFLGDNMFEESLTGLVNQFMENKNAPDFAAQVSVKKVSDPSSFGVAVVDKEFRLRSVEEKPKSPKSDLALVGTYCFTSKIHTAIDLIKPSPRGELEITDAIQQLLNSGLQIGVSEVSGWWFDTGNPESFLECNSKVLDGQEIPSRNLPSNVSVIEPCAIDTSAILSNCKIGPHVSIGPNVSVSDATIERSVLLENSSVSGPAIVLDSILGRRSSLRTVSPTSARITLGDDCHVEIGKEWKYSLRELQDLSDQTTFDIYWRTQIQKSQSLML